MSRIAAARLDRVDRKHLPREVRAGSGGSPRPRPRRHGPKGADEERSEVKRALESTAGNITHAAKLLGMTRHGLKKEDAASRAPRSGRARHGESR